MNQFKSLFQEKQLCFIIYTLKEFRERMQTFQQECQYIF
jgi:hypothetical protein